MRPFVRFSAVASAFALLVGSTTSLEAQAKEAKAAQPPAKQEQKAPPAMDHSKMDHSKMAGAKAEAWKELDEFHMQMMATWHPAKEQNNMAPLKSMADRMLVAAKALAASKAPAGCQKPEIQKAQAEMPAATEKVVALVKKKASDADLKAALSTLHDKFEVLGDGCNTGMNMKH